MRTLSKAERWYEVKKQSYAYAENPTGKKIKHLQSDNGKEYLTNKFNDFLQFRGIRQRLTVSPTPEQNRIAERKNRTLVETAQCFLLYNQDSQRRFGLKLSQRHIKLEIDTLLEA